MNNPITNPGSSDRFSARLNQYIESYLVRLTERNYAVDTIKSHRIVIHRLAAIMKDRGILPEELTEELAAALMKGEERTRREPHKSANIARRFVGYLIETGLATAPPLTPKQIAREALRGEYEDYLRRHRGLSDRSINHCWSIAARFLDYRFGDQEDDLGGIRPTDIAAFLEHLTNRKPPFRDKTPPTHLRNFLGYLFKCGVTSANLALCVPSVAQRYDARRPRHLTPEQVETVLAVVRSSPKHGRRDYAMLLLMARLGLRAPEVVAMQLDDIDWRAGELLVRGKGQRGADHGRHVARMERRNAIDTWPRFLS